MLFSEVYGAYYNTLFKLLEKAVEGELTPELMLEIVREEGFEESVLTIPQALKEQTWPLITSDYGTPLEHRPTMPLTTLQKRWLKALLSDPRIKLFAPPMDGLEEVEPLYPADTFVYYDRFNDGDPFEDPGYIKRFRCILSAIRQKRWLRIHFEGGKGLCHSWRCVPYKLEYSPKDDKFRLISANNRESLSINLARIKGCFLMEPCEEGDYRPKAMKKRKLILELTDDRNALERVMLHFSHLDKETERIDDTHYKITLFYEREDETELLIRVLSFGPVLKVIFPHDFIEKLQERLKKQKNLRAQD
ncbi:MAG: WYL domain-containing protein [Oscillospiraceae bacterium]|nr:WYL domain-containing protein [Oscillospiraceae bacterium]